MNSRHGTRQAANQALLLAGGLFLGSVMMMDAIADGEEGLLSPIVVEPAKSATLPDLMTKLRSERLIYTGETHTAYADHLLQLEVLRGMASRPEGLAIGVEWFQARFQPVLDAFIAGEIDEAALLRQTEYYTRWQFDYRLYRPIIRFARDRGIPIIALNASTELTTEIRRLGINGLPKPLRDELPDSYDVNDKVYEEALREMFSMHKSDDAMFERFVEIQLTWDETMAQRVAEYLKANPAGRMLVMAGKGHIGGRSGIPNRVTRRTGIAGKTIATFSPSSTLFNEADYFILANDRHLPPLGLMRIMLDLRSEGVFVQGFTHGSPAKKAGVEQGDRIVAIDGVPISDIADLKIAMIDRAPGSDIELTVSRDSLLRGEQEETLRFALVGEAPHG